ncbi:MAG: sulfotransferase [Acidimicrobiia bacterium]|nr:sulfotransferase [Acidimicrobiia bacterium]MDH5237418.1 sulfotransferase [Acidimicrobiia bacterium]
MIAGASAAATSAVSGRPDAHHHRPTRLVYIGGVGRSGSTLLNDLLGQHRDVVAVGELVHLFQRGLVENNLCGCGARFADCPFWTRVGGQLDGGWDVEDGHRYLALKQRVDRNRHSLSLIAPLNLPRFRNALSDYGDRYRRLIEAVRSQSGAAVVVDSTKQISTALLMRRLPLDLRIVHLVRDSRGVAYSWTKEKRKVEVIDDDAMMNRYPPALMAWRWLSWNIVFASFRLLGVPVVTVRYEDLIAHPDQTLRRVLRFADLDAGALDFIERDTIDLQPVHSVAGNPSRFQKGKVALRLDEAWRDQMPAGARRWVTVLTAPLLGRYGYLRGGR